MIPLCDDCTAPAYAGGTYEGKPWVYCAEHHAQRIVDGSLPPPVCDFCSGTNVSGGTTYICEDFVMLGVSVDAAGVEVDSITSGFMGDWCACSRCARLIDAEDWPALERRSVDHFVLRHGGTRIDAAVPIHALHEQFRLDKTGATRPVP